MSSRFWSKVTRRSWTGDTGVCGVAGRFGSDPETAFRSRIGNEFERRLPRITSGIVDVYLSHC